MSLLSVIYHEDGMRFSTLKIDMWCLQAMRCLQGFAELEHLHVELNSEHSTYLHHSSTHYRWWDTEGEAWKWG